MADAYITVAVNNEVNNVGVSASQNLDKERQKGVSPEKARRLKLNY